ncbi:MAG: NADH-quinone oxidoreductase subunit NuoK [Bdellovibrionales bacterium]|nr:NADH-quinone oxidoreductase subunit NuoK [Bdellovibrionales bacterium]
MLSNLFSIGIGHYLFVSGALFVMGMLGVLLRKNILVILMSIELMLNAVNVAFVTFAYYLNDVNGAVIVLFVIAIAATEAAVGLALVVLLYKNFKEVNIRFFEHLKG